LPYQISEHPAHHRTHRAKEGVVKGSLWDRNRQGYKKYIRRDRKEGGLAKGENQKGPAPIRSLCPVEDPIVKPSNP
jgi:hypothetical protein